MCVVVVVVVLLHTGELSPLEFRLEAEKKAKEEAVAAKALMEKKARTFVTDQKNTIEQLTKEKVSLHESVIVPWCEVVVNGQVEEFQELH